MKRDMDYIRQLLLNIEASDSPPSLPQLLPSNPDEFDRQKLHDHLRMLSEEAGFVSGTTIGALKERYWFDLRLTWLGHDFLDSVRDPEIWAKTKAGAEKAGVFTIGLLKDLATGFVKKQIEDKTGIKL